MNTPDPTNPGLATEAKTARRSLPEFLKESNISVLVFTGKCMDYFGLGVVLSFLLGAAAIYGYSLFKPLPYEGRFRDPVAQVPPSAPPVTHSAPEAPKKIIVRGVFTDSSQAVVKQPFQIGVIAETFGEFTKGDGSFFLEVPPQARYKIAIWKGGYENISVLEVIRDENNNLEGTRWVRGDISHVEPMDRSPKVSSVAQQRRNEFLGNTIFNTEAQATKLVFKENATTTPAE